MAVIDGGESCESGEEKRTDMIVGKNWDSLVILSSSAYALKGLTVQRRSYLLEELYEKVAASLEWSIWLAEQPDDDGRKDDELNREVARKL